jgi:hypothetical protein
MFRIGSWSARTAIPRECLAQQLQSLHVELEGKDGDTGRVSIGMRHGGDELAAKQVIREGHDRNALSCLLCSARCFGPSHHEHIRPRFGQLNGGRLVRSSGNAKAAAIDIKIAAFHKSGLPKFVEEAFRSLRPQHRDAIMPPDYLRARQAAMPPLLRLESKNGSDA